MEIIAEDGMEKIIEVANLHNEYKKGVEVLKGVDLSVNKGEVVAILGPSGSGKTTLLRCMSFLESPTEGEMFFNGQTFNMGNITKKEIAAIRKDMGYVFQNFNLFRNMTVMGNVLEGLVTARKMDKTLAKNRATEVLTKVGMIEFANKYPDEISGGQQQRVAIARAIAPNPKVVFFDEPTSALDPELIGEVLDVMKKLAGSGVTMVIVTHQLEFAREVASKVILMENGTIVEQGTSYEMFNNPKEARTRQFLGSDD